MTNIRIFLITLAMLPWTTSTAQPIACHTAAHATSAPTALNNPVGQHLIAEERASWDLAIMRDAAAYTALHAPDFMTVTGNGVVGKTSSEASAMDPHARFDQCELSGFDAHFLAENAVLVTYHVKAAGFDHDKAFQLDSYASSLWMKRQGQWLNVFYQATPQSSQ
jgi:hypothetical protein